MANPFDQFDGVATAPNPFDQFDEKPSNPFDQFDAKAVNPFDQFDSPAAKSPTPADATGGNPAVPISRDYASQFFTPADLNQPTPALPPPADYSDEAPPRTPALKVGKPQSLGDFLVTPAAPLLPKMTAEEAGKWASITEVAPILSVLPKNVSDRVAGIAENVVADTGNSFTSPVGVATAGIAALPSLAQKAVTAAFLASTAKEAPDIYDAIKDAKTPEERDQGIVRAIESAAVIGGTAFHLLDRARIASNTIAPTQPQVQPTPAVPSIAEMRANAIANEVKNALPRLPGETQDRIAGILQKQASGAELEPSEHASLIQVRSYASKLKADAGETAQFTGIAPETEKAVTSTGAKIEPPAASTEATIPQGEATSGASPQAKGGRSSLFDQAMREALPIEAPKEEAAPLTAEATGVEPRGMSEEDALQKAQEIAHKYATDVAGGDVRKYDAARDAALDNARSSIKLSLSDNPNSAQFNPDFMRKSAMEAAGKIGDRIGPSLDEEEGRSTHETTPSDQLSPAEEITRNEYVSKAVSTLGELDDRESDIVKRHTMNGETFEEISKDHGISKQRVQQIHADALEKMRTKMEEDGYAGGPGAMGPKEALEMEAKSNQNTTSIKRAVVDLQRKIDGRPDIPIQERANSQRIISDAEDAVTANPEIGKQLVNRINASGVSDVAISPKDRGILLVERNRLRVERDQWDERAADQTSTKEERDMARAQSADLDSQIDQIDQANRKSSTTWSDEGRLIQQVIREDYTAAGIERKVKAKLERSLTPEERIKIKEQAAKIKELQDNLEKAQTAASEGEAHAEMSRIYEATIKDVEKELAARPNIPKPVLEIARGIVDRWKADADEAHKDLRDRLGHTLAGVPDPRIILDVARIMRGHVGELGLKFGEISARLIEEYGPKVKPFLKDAWKKAQELIEKEKITNTAKEAIKEGRGSRKEKTLVDYTAKAKAESTAKEPLNPSTVGAIVREHIKAGVHGEDALMAATHETVKEAYPDVSEREVRNAFTDYGNAKYPSKEAVEAEARETRTLVRLQESINREKEGLAGKIDPKTGEPMAASRTGFQPDKATQSIREKQAQLNELLKKRQGPPSPDKLASRDEAKQTALENRIADLDKELKTGEKRPQGEAVPDSDKTQQLRAERDAMQEKLNEIREAAKPKETPEEKYNETRMKQVQKQLDEANERLRTGNFAPKPKPIPKQKFAATAHAEAELAEAKKKIDIEIERQRLAGRSMPQRTWDAAKALLKLPTQAAIFGHGTVGMFTHAGGLAWRPTRATIFWKNFGRQWGMWLNKPLHEQLIYKLKNDPQYAMWKKAGASIDPEKTYTDYGMYAKWMGKLGDAGARGFDALKLTRLEMNKADWARVPDSIKLDPEAAAETQKRIAEINNKATGAIPKGNGALENLARNPYADAVFFAPKLYASRWARVVLDPIKTIGTFADWNSASPADKFAATTRLKNAAEFAAAYAVALGTNQAILSATGSNQKVNFTDPTKADWLKFKAGGKEIVADGGLLDPVRLIGQIVIGDLIMDKSGQHTGDRFENAGKDLLKYARGKLNPTAGIITDVATRRDFQGRPLPFSDEKPKYRDQQKYTWIEYALQHGPIPIAGGVKVAYDAMREKGLSAVQAMDIIKGAAISVLGTTGAHINPDYGAERPTSSARPASKSRGTSIQGLHSRSK